MSSLEFRAFLKTLEKAFEKMTKEEILEFVKEIQKENK